MAKNIKKTHSKAKSEPSKSKEIEKTKSTDLPSNSLVKPKRRNTKKEQPEQQLKQQQNDAYSLSLEAGVYTLKMHQTYTLSQEHKLYKEIKDLFELFRKKQQKINKKIHMNVPHSYFPTFEFALQGERPQDNKCSICQFEYEEPPSYHHELVLQSENDIISLSCTHLLHKGCFLSLKGDQDWIRCPVCSTIFGQMIGDQPPGKMTHFVNQLMHCDGYDSVGTIVIDYNMHSGKRGNVSFPGTHRSAYLPDNKEGNEVLQLLKKAFDRKLIFTIGRSVTTGRDNQVVWNGIHHKTNTSGGSAYFGYPDPTYFDRVKLELAAKGVV